jgi:PBSX family phage terminase large subunit
MNKKGISLKEKEIQKKAREQLWREGILEWKLHPSQKDMYDFFHGKKDKTIIFNCSRRLGKSWLLLLIAIEVCLKKKSTVKFVLPETGWARKVIKPVMQKILEDCPNELIPTFKTQDNMYVFANGSEIQLAGTDNGNYEKLRGGDADLCLVDEAGFCSDLNHIISSILIPTTLLTKGRIILSSTTPDNPNHEFIQQMKMAASDKRMIVKTLYDGLEDSKRSDSPHITPEIIEEIILGIPGGVDSDAFKTEFLCQLISDSDKSVVPEFSRKEQDIVCEWRMPNFCDKYVSMDIGFKDLTAVLFAYYDFENAVLVIQDEVIINGPELTTKKLADEIQIKESKLWTSHLTGEQDKPYLRVSDNNLLVINDLAKLHGIYFSPTEKQNKDAAINQVRMMIDEGQIKINPKCVHLIDHIKLATWGPNKKDYARVSGHHYDALDAFIYLVRNISFTHNPFPKGYRYQGLGNRDNVFFKESTHEPTTDIEKHLSKQFKPKTTYRRKTN